MTKTTFATLDDHAKAAATWHVVDASQQTLGRLAVQIAEVLMGKTTPLYTPHINVGPGVIVVNAGKVRVTGNKLAAKTYRHYTGHVGGLHERKLSDYLENRPEFVITTAVRRMLPKSRMGKAMLSRLKVYAGSEHPHQAQKPTPLES